MTVRIRYQLNKKGLMESVRELVSKQGTSYKVFIDPIKRVYRIYNVRSRRNVKIGGENVNNMEVLYRCIRRDLKQLGVGLTHETRSKGEKSDRT